MKVLHINRNYLTSALHQVMLNHLDKLDMENKIFAPIDDLRLSIIKPNNNVVVSECFSKKDRYFYFRKQKKIQVALESSINVNDFDVIQAYTLFTDGNCAMNLAQKYRKPFIVAVRNTDVNDFFKKLPFLRCRGIKIMCKADKILFLSNAYCDQVIKSYVPRRYRELILNKSLIIPNGIDDFWLNSKYDYSSLSHLNRINKKQLKIIFAGRIEHNKNIEKTVEAIEILNNEGWMVEFTVVGKVEDSSIYEAITKYNFVKYVTPRPKEELIKLYRENDIYVMPSFTESFGLVYAEAISQGIPVIYTKGQGFDGQFAEGLVGYHVNAYDAEDIAKAIKKIALNYEDIQKNCVSSAKKFSWDCLVKEYYNIYQEL